MYSGNYTIGQQFEFDYQNGYYVIRNVGSGKVLDAQSGGKTSGTNVWQYTSNQTAVQQWNIIKNADGTYTFSNGSSGVVLDIQSGLISNNSNIQVYQSNGTQVQKFILKTILCYIVY